MEHPKSEGTSAGKSDVLYTAADYRSWPDDQRWELIHGIAYGMSPASRLTHQRVLLDLAHALEGFLDGKPCEAFIAPVDVYLPEIGKGDTIVQPDILVVCDPSKLTEEGVRGAPDFIVEILSDSTAYKDLNEKKTLYEAQGVREYWIVNPGAPGVLVWRQEAPADGPPRFAPVREYRKGEQVDSAVLAGFVWRMGKV